MELELRLNNKHTAHYSLQNSRLPQTISDYPEHVFLYDPTIEQITRFNHIFTYTYVVTNIIAYTGYLEDISWERAEIVASIIQWMKIVLRVSKAYLNIIQIL